MSLLELAWHSSLRVRYSEKFRKIYLNWLLSGQLRILVPLRDENRYFVKEGIKQMRVSKRPAIQALARIAGTEQATLIGGVNRIHDWTASECGRASR